MMCAQAQLQAELVPYGIDTQVVDRYIVSWEATHTAVPLLHGPV